MNLLARCKVRSQTKSDLVRVDEDVLFTVGISNEVVKAAVIVGQSVELFNGDAALVFYDPLEAPIDVAHAEYDAVAKFMLKAGNILVRVFHARARRKRFTAAEANVHAIADAVGGLIEKVSGIGSEHGAVIRMIHFYSEGSGIRD